MFIRHILIPAMLLLAFTSLARSQVCDPCDFDGNGVVGVEDYFLLLDEVLAGTDRPEFNVSQSNFETEVRVNFGDTSIFLQDKLRTFPGDSNWDGVFDTRDLLQVMQSALYEVDNAPPATWGTGDWEGDLRFSASDFVYVFNSGGFLRPPLRDTPIPDLPDPRQPETVADVRLLPTDRLVSENAVTLSYNPTSGHVATHNNASATTTVVSIRSDSGLLLESRMYDRPCVWGWDVPDDRGRCQAFASLFDVSQAEQFFALAPEGQNDMGFGMLLPTGFSLDMLLEDLHVNGALLQGGGLTAASGGGPFLWIVSGDFDRDGTLAASDIDLLAARIRESSTDMTFDLNDDWQVTQADHRIWVHVFADTHYGDANLDGRFSSEDLVMVFQRARFENRMSASWSDGDWNGDQLFNTSDLVLAFQDGGYDRSATGGPAPFIVPEPSVFLLTVAGVFAWSLKANLKSHLQAVENRIRRS